MNPTKIVAGGSSGGGGALLAVYIAGRFGAHLTAEDGAAIVAAATAGFAFIAHNGLLSLGRILLHGDRAVKPSR